jgi:hypothetical protein
VAGGNVQIHGVADIWGAVRGNVQIDALAPVLMLELGGCNALLYSCLQPTLHAPSLSGRSARSTWSRRVGTAVCGRLASVCVLASLGRGGGCHCSRQILGQVLHL